MKNYKKTFVKAILAGSAISLGCIANICAQSRIAGALFFIVGLFLVLTRDLNLFTGKICFVLENNVNKDWWKQLIVIYIGNFIGAFIFGLILRNGKFIDLISVFAISLNDRINSPWYQTTILAVLCNICIYIAVDKYKDSLVKEWERILSLVFGVSIFVLCGFEHIIADFCYVTMCWAWSGQTVLFLLEVTFGNIIGALIIRI